MKREGMIWRVRPKQKTDGAVEAAHDTFVALHNIQVNEIYDDHEAELEALKAKHEKDLKEVLEKAMGK